MIDVHWITRVPAELSEARTWLKKSVDKITWQPFDDNYRAATQEVTIYGIKQRWLLIESKQALARELQTFQRRLDKKSTELAKTPGQEHQNSITVQLRHPERSEESPAAGRRSLTAFGMT